MATLDVKPWADGQGDFVTIDAENYDPSFHQRLDGDDTPVPGPFDSWTRQAMIDKATADCIAFLNTLSDEDLRHGLEDQAERVRRMAADVAQEAALDAGVQPETSEPVVDVVEDAETEAAVDEASGNESASGESADDTTAGAEAVEGEAGADNVGGADSQSAPERHENLTEAQEAALDLDHNGSAGGSPPGGNRRSRRAAAAAATPETEA